MAWMRQAFWIALLVVSSVNANCQNVKVPFAKTEEEKRLERQIETAKALAAVTEATWVLIPDTDESVPPTNEELMRNATRAEIEQCYPVLSEMSSTASRSEQSQIYLAMSGLCKELHWQRKRCARNTSRVQAMDDEEERKKKFAEEALASCAYFIPYEALPSLSRSEVQEGMESVRRKIAQCGRQYEVEGKVEVRVVIADRVILFEDADRGSREFGFCIEAAFRDASYRFAPRLTVTYPYLLGQKNRE